MSKRPCAERWVTAERRQLRRKSRVTPTRIHLGALHSSYKLEYFELLPAKLRKDMRNRAIRLAHYPWRCHRHSTAYAKILPNVPAARNYQLQSIPSTTDAIANTVASNDAGSSTSTACPDARFEVLGPSSSLLAVSLSASQNLFTRRGTLVGASGSPEHATSTLSPLSPLLRAPLGVPFLYQRITSATPLELLVSAKSPHTSFAIINLDGTTDWKVTQRNGLLAWAGHRLTVEPTVNRGFVRNEKIESCQFPRSRG